MDFICRTWEQMTKEFFEEEERWDLEPQPASLWLASTLRGRDQGGLSRRASKFFGYIFNPAGKSQKNEERRRGEGTRRYTGAKTCRGGVNVKAWWSTCTAFPALAVKVGRGLGPSWTRVKDGRHKWGDTIQIQKKRQGNLDWALHKHGKSCKDHLEEYEMTVSHGNYCRR